MNNTVVVENQKIVKYQDNINVDANSYLEFNKKDASEYMSLAEMKREVLKSYKLTETEFQTVAAIVASEAKNNSYDDAYAVINTIYNRTKSKRWVRHVSNLYGSGKGTSLYYQVIAPNQFTVYSSGSYKKYLNNLPKEVNEAVIKLLYTEDTVHNYLSFKSSSYKGAAVQLVSGGNKYHSELKDSDKL